MKPVHILSRILALSLSVFALAACGEPEQTAPVAPAAGQPLPALPAMPQPTGPRTLTIESPRNAAAVGGTFEVKGSTTLVPAETGLVYRFYGTDGNLVSSGPAPTQGQPGQPGTFSATVSFEPGSGGVGWLEVVDQNASDGSVIASASVNVMVAGDEAPATIPSPQQSLRIDMPQEQASVSSLTEARGSLAVVPAEEKGLLSYRVYDVDGGLIGVGPLSVTGQPGQPGTFVAPIEYALDITSTGRIMVVDQDADSGAIMGHAAVNVILAPTIPVSEAELAADEIITIDAPQEREAVSDPFIVKGSISVLPFDGSLTYRLYDRAGKLVGTGAVAIEGEPGKGGTFSVSIKHPAGASGAVRLEILDLDQADGMIYASNAVNLFLGGAPQGIGAPAVQTIVLESPLTGDIVTAPAQVSGNVAATPFEKNLVYRVYDAAGNLIGAGPVPVTGELGQPGTFAVPISFTAGVGNVGRVQVLDINAADGTIIASATAEVQFGAAQ